MEEGTVDLTVTSPPYNVGKDYGVTSDDLAFNDYLAFMQKVIAEINRVTKKGGRIAVNIPTMMNNREKPKGAGFLAPMEFYIIMLKSAGFTLREIIVWVKSYKEAEGAYCGGNTAWGSWKSPANPYCRSTTEFILVAHKESAFKEGTDTDLTAKEFLKYTRSCWFFPAEIDRTHPAPFPEELPKRLIKLYCFVGDVVLDPFAGSGTTLVVAKRLKRQYVGFEINPPFYTMAKERVSQTFLPQVAEVA